MEGAESDSDDWVINCSDEELVSTSETQESWEPSPQEILNMYEILESNSVLELEWRCPGRRSPSVNSNKSDLLEKGSISDEDSNKQVEPNEFDFDDEFGSERPSLKLSARKRNNATSAQKRVARLDKVMFDIQRHRKLDELELQKSLSDSTCSSPSSKTEQKTS
ncbi:PAXIP1-associated glutamate-rich protein 1 [Parasteatoda tepidariorum]|uniref:PAXIP1-associated protein 1 n=1 Tax=Parasteatoda tepidariorum TaxID=114398 RepID=A0A2L2YF13_PARTP|nr:PAXIP1-associated glutamate-rich protein 1 [Parasteatoda tepidariorum]